MSKFNTLNNDVLLQVAEEFAVDLPEPEEGKKLTKAVIVSKLVEDGVTWEMYKEAFPDPEDLPGEIVEGTIKASDITTDTLTADKIASAPVKPAREDMVLLKMERQNPRLEIRGYTFRKDHPFVPVREVDAEYILTHEEGFKIAMPSEAEEFYK